MKIRDILQSKKSTLSFEIFPPNERVSLKSVMNSASRMAAYEPDFMSVTYKAQGGSGDHTVEIAHALDHFMGIPAVAHLTCVTTDKEEIDAIAHSMKEKGVENILALRGDIPEGEIFPHPNRYSYAYELVKCLKEIHDFSVGVACFPEGQNASVSLEQEVLWLKEKVAWGADFMTTQMFFDNEKFYRFYDLLDKHQINTPIIAGIMPVTNGKQIKRIAKLSNANIPKNLLSILDKYGDDSKACLEVGCAYAMNQTAELLSHGVKGVHIYTMNKPEIAESISKGIGSLFR